MIVVCPMITSRTVSPNILPAIAKSLEKYLIIYQINDLLSTVNRSLVGTAVNIVRGRLFAENKLHESVQVQEQQHQQQQQQKPPIRPAPRNRPPEPDRVTRVDPSTVLNTAISVEPTWVKIETSRRGLQLLGIKVVPFAMKSDINIEKLMLRDAGKNVINSFFKGVTRSAVRTFSAMQRKIMPVSSEPLSGDPTTDMTWGVTTYGTHVFFCFSQLDISRIENMMTAAFIRKLFVSKWNSFVIADDINKRSTFCMQQQKGLCTVVPYSYMLSALGEEYQKVYDNLEDVRKSASNPFIGSRGTTMSAKKVFENYNIKNVVESYCLEDWKQKMNLFTPKRLLLKAYKLRTATSEEKLQSIVEDMPDPPMKKLEFIARTKIGGFKQDYQFACAVIKNSVDIDEDSANRIAYLMAVSTKIGNGDRKQLRSNLKLFVQKFRLIPKDNDFKRKTKILVLAFGIPLGFITIATPIASLALNIFFRSKFAQPVAAGLAQKTAELMASQSIVSKLVGQGIHSIVELIRLFSQRGRNVQLLISFILVLIFLGVFLRSKREA